jgi:hypothetical protein
MNIPTDMIHVAPLHALETVKELKPGAPIHLIELDDPIAFMNGLPPFLRTPSQGRPNDGLPPNAWCGVVLNGHASIRRAVELLDVRARVLWVHLKEASWTETTRLFEHWRCPRCGRRGKAPRPKLCPHAKFLCGDTKLEPQIQWLILDQPMTPLMEDVRRLGGLVWPDDVPVVHPAELIAATRLLQNAAKGPLP